MDREQKSLSQSVDRLAKVIGRSTSLRMSFMRAIVTGLGTAIGATIVATIVIALLLKMIGSLGTIPVLNGLINDIPVQPALNSMGK